MEIQYEEIIRGFQNSCAGSMAESDDDEETLSFCDMLLCDSAGTAAKLASTERDSNPDSSDLYDFHFDFDFGGSISNASQTSAADDLFFHGSLLPLSECKVRFSYNNCNSLRENRVVLNEKHQALISDSVDSKSSSISGNSQASRRSFNYSASQKGLRAQNSSAVGNKSNLIANWTSFSCNKRSSGWLQYFSLGINRTPVMKLEELRLRQCKRGENGVDKPVLKRSVSSYYEEGPILKKKAAALNQRSKSVKENKRAVETRRTKGLMILALFKSFNSCKSSISSVVNCTERTKCLEREALVPSLKVAT